MKTMQGMSKKQVEMVRELAVSGTSYSACYGRGHWNTFHALEARGFIADSIETTGRTGLTRKIQCLTMLGWAAFYAVSE
jgi:hypothetical protein